MIRSILKEEVSFVRNVAYQTWPSTFASILSEEQIQFMLTWMYDEGKLEEQLENGHEFYGFFENNQLVGFIGIEEKARENAFKIHKLYVLPEQQGKQIGVKLIDFAQNLFPEKSIFLNVNRFNQAVKFYQKLGFVIEKEEDISIGNDFWMNDYVMFRENPSKLASCSNRYRHI